MHDCASQVLGLVIQIILHLVRVDMGPLESSSRSPVVPDERIVGDTIVADRWVVYGNCVKTVYYKQNSTAN